MRVVSISVRVLVVLVFLVIAPTKVSAAPFECEIGFYQMIGGQLTVLNPDDGSYIDIGGTGPNLTNAIGYNTEDNYIYGIRNDTGFEANLVRIHSDGSLDTLGVPTGLPVEAYIAGDFDESGNLYVRELGVIDEIWIIDVSEQTASVLNLSANLFVSELVYIDGFLYAQTEYTFYRINASDGTVTSAAASGLPGGLASLEAFGAGWASNGELYFARNATGVVYQVENYAAGTPVFTPKVQGAVPINNDGASCPNAASPNLGVAAVSDSYSTTINTPLTVSTASGILLNDSGDTISVTNNTQPDHGSVEVNSDGSFTYTPDQDFVGTDTFTYTITDLFDMTSDAEVTITIADENPDETQDSLASTGQTVWLTYALSALLLLTGRKIIKQKN